MSAAGREQIVFPIEGMDCADCARHVERAIAATPGVGAVTVLLTAEKALVTPAGETFDPAAIRSAVVAAGYRVPERNEPSSVPPHPSGDINTTRVVALFALVVALVLGVVATERIGLTDRLNDRLPWPAGAAIVLVAGFPIFRNVVRVTVQRQVIAHTLMSLGAFAALAVGEWTTAAIVVLFMRVGDLAERFTAERSRRALHELDALQPRLARVHRDGQEIEFPIAQVHPGDTVVVRPGERIPVDGQVIAGRATIDQAAITGESMPVEAEPGATVYAATIATLGGLRVRATAIGAETTIGRVVRLVEEAEANRADVQRVADRFSAWYLPVVATVAALTLIIRRDPLATTAVLVVACSCSFALATPIAILASIGAAARRGLLIKGGKHLETLARTDLLLIDKTGTVTTGRPRLTEIVSLDGLPESDLLSLAASAERWSEHPLATAVTEAARDRGLAPAPPADFRAVPGQGVVATIDGQRISVGNRRLIADPAAHGIADRLEAAGATTLLVARDDRAIGVLAAADTLRPEVPDAVAELRQLGVTEIELLTGDNERVATAIAGRLGVTAHANLLPEEKIAIVRAAQAEGRVVVMIGDGVNDAPALAQADVGIAMGAAGTAVAVEAADIALLRDDWTLVPDVFRISQRTLRTVKVNIAFTAAYNLLGLSLAAFGILPPVLAAAAQSLPDLGILANSSRLLRYRPNRQSVA